MSKISCEVIKDVLPLYIDGVASEGTRNLVEEHIRTCNSCKVELEMLSGEVAIPVSKEAEVEEANLLGRMKKSWKKKQIRVAVISVILSAVVIVGAYFLAVFPMTVIPYDKSVVGIEAEGNKLYAEFKGKNYHGYVGWEGKGIVKGQKKHIYVLHYNENLWSKYIDPIIGSGVVKEDRRTELGLEPGIEAIYYGAVEERYVGPPLEEELDEMTLLWEK